MRPRQLPSGLESPAMLKTEPLGVRVAGELAVVGDVLHGDRLVFLQSSSCGGI